MGTHDDTNKAEPQNEFLSGFKIKDRIVSQSEEKQQPFVAQTGKIDGGLASKKSASGSQNRTDSNPYQLTQQMSKNTPLEQIGNDPFRKESGTSFVQKLKSKFFHEKSGTGNARQRVMVVMIPILFIIMIFAFRQVLSKPPQKTKGADSKNKSTLAADKSSGNDIEWKIPDPLPVSMRDPIKFEQNATNSTGQENPAGDIENGVMYVQSILYSNDKPSVVIGNRIVYLNQEINGAIVVEINKDNIVFERDGKKWTQKVAEEVLQEKVDENQAEESRQEERNENI